MNGIRTMLSRSLTALACAWLMLACGGCAPDRVGGDNEPAATVSKNPKDRPERAIAPKSHPANALIASAANRDVKVNQLSGRAFEVKEFGSEVEGKATDVLESLKAQALAGDATASYAIFLKLNSCASFSQKRAKSVAESGNTKLVSECDGLSAEDEVSSSKWLALAAEQGNIGAQLLYSMDSEIALGGAAALLRNPEATIEYKQRATSYLESLASQGSVDALLQLGNAYQAGVLVNEDLVSSRAYFEAVRLTDPSLVSKQQLKGLESSMTAQQLSMAIRKGEQIYGSCCR